jgi:hypothetical protein
LNTLALAKAKLKDMVFNLLDAVQEQLGKWYFIEFTLTNKFDTEDKYWFPLIACMQNKIGALSLQSQILKDLSNGFFVSLPVIVELPKSQKDLKIEQVESQLKAVKSETVKIQVLKAVKKSVLNQAAKLFTQEDLSNGNLDIETEYAKDIEIPFKIGIMSNQGVPLHQIENHLTVKIDKGKIDPSFALPEPKRPDGGDVDKMNDLIKNQK